MALQHRRIFSLAYAFLFVAIAKFAVFFAQVSIMGLNFARTSLSVSNTPSVFSFDLWYHVEAYTDFRDLYMKDLVAPFITPYFGAHNIYYLGTIVYNYPPLFLYLIGGFASLVNLLWFPALPLVIFDLLTVIPLYKIAEEFMFPGNKKIAFSIAIIWGLNPLNLFYNDLIWLNPGPTTFFLVLSLYFFLRKNWLYSSLSLAISTGFKQVSIVFLPVLLIFLWRTVGFSKKLAIYILSYIGTMIVISIPYILPSYSNGQFDLKSAQNYFWSLNFPILGYPSNVSNNPPTFSTSLSEPVRLTFFLGINQSQAIQNLVAQTYTYLNYFLIVGYLGLLVVIFFTIRKKRGSESIRWNNVFTFAMAALLIFLAFFGRGVYKYYFASLTPLALPFFSNRKGAIIFEVLSVGLVLVPREATPWFAVLLLTLLPTFYGTNKTQEIEVPFTEKPGESGPVVS